MSSHYGLDVPTWDGSAASFETFVISCKWFQKSLKDNEQKQAASRVWQKLTGPAKAVVRHLNPDEYEDSNGLSRLLDVLRASPLQQLPVPDSFARLEAWHHLRRGERETIPELLVREEDLFVQLQQSLLRARKDKHSARNTATGNVGTTSNVEAQSSAPQVDPTTSPTRSPMTGPERVWRNDRQRQAEPYGTPAFVATEVQPATLDYFEDEMRGYRLLKSARVSTQEKQYILTQTGNSTHFLQVRHALRTLFADENEKKPSDFRKSGKVWWSEPHDGYDFEEYEAYAEWGDWEGSPDSWSEWNDEDVYWNDDWEHDAWWYEYPEDVTQDELPPDETSDLPEEKQYNEAYALAGEAHRTLQEARDAVKRVRQARGYFSPESNTGKGMAAGFVKGGKGKASPSGSPSNRSGEPCLICGKPSHHYSQCPDRFSKGGSKSKSKGKGKYKSKRKGSFGKGKGKGKGKAFFHDYMNVLATHWDDGAVAGRKPTRVIIDTGATENAIGIHSLSELINGGRFKYQVCSEDTPTFRFGNGHRDRALSRVDLFDTSLGSISFYVLGNQAGNTPPLLGARTLRSKKTLLSYATGVFMYEDEHDHEKLKTVMMQALDSGHVTIDLTQKALELPWDAKIREAWCTFLEDPKDGMDAVEKFENHTELHDQFREFYIPLNFIGMVALADEAVESDARMRLQLLAQRLQGLQQKIYQTEPNDKQIGFRGRRSSRGRLAMHGEPQELEDKSQPTCGMADMREMRHQSVLHVQEGGTWEQPSDGQRATSHPLGTEGTRGDHSEFRDVRVQGEWQDHGDQGQDAADGSANVIGIDNDVRGVRPEVVQVRSGRWEADSELAQGNTKAEEDDLQADRGDRGEDITRCNILGGGTRGLATNIASDGKPHQEGADGDHEPAGEHGLSGGSPISREGCGQCDEHSVLGGREGRSSVLWKAVMDLRRRIRGLSERGDDSPRVVTGSLAEAMEQVDGLEVVKPPESSNTTMHNDDGHAVETPLELVGDALSHTTLEKQQSTTNEHGVICHPAPDEVPLIGDLDRCQQSKNNVVGSNLAKRLAVKAAMIGAMVLAPTSSLIGQLRGAADFMEIACSPESALSNEMIKMGYAAKRINYKEGFDLETRRGTSLLKQEIIHRTPRLAWVSLPCTRLSPLVNLTQRTEAEWAAFEKRQGADLRRADEVSDGICEGITNGMEFAWEWPTNAVKGWRSRAIRKLILRCKELGITLYWARCHGCAYGLKFNGLPVLKGWTILTTNRKIWLGLQRRCPGHTDHVECRGQVATASAYYPIQMVKAVTKAVASSWSDMDERARGSLGRDVEVCLCESSYIDQEERMNWHVRSEEPGILALSRTKFPEEPPQGKKLEGIRQTMLRIHRASGHTSMSNLEKLLKARGAPKWATEMARLLQCPDCIESRRPRPPPPSSDRDQPGLFEQVGTDVFEVEVPTQDEAKVKQKAKFVIWRDRASGLAMVDCLQRFGGPDQPTHWEPTTRDLIASFGKWLMVNPAPKWVISDPATCYTSLEWLEYMGRSGVGVLTTPAEAHWALGAEEGCIGILKSTCLRIMREAAMDMDVEEAMQLATHGHNQTIGPTGFSPFQWTRGSSAPDPDLPLGLDPKKAFEGMLKLKLKAKLAYEAESARSRLSKLNNAIGRPSSNFKTGALVMVWRQKMRPGKTSGRWMGPLRMLLQEGNTLWLATGASLVKAKVNQVRLLTKREEQQSSLEGTAVYKMPVNLESLMKEFTGKHFTNITGEVPSEQMRQADLGETEVRLEPRDRVRQDTWRIEGQWMIRVHTAPRLALFIPSRVTTSPIPEERLTGLRLTKMKPMMDGAEVITIKDDYQQEQDPGRLLQDRWTGETWFEVRREARPEKPRAKMKQGVKRKQEFKDVPAEGEEAVDVDLPDGEAIIAGDPTSSAADSRNGGTIFPEEPDGLNRALHERGPQAVDGVPGVSTGDDLAPIGNRCPVKACQLRGGHEGPHIDDENRRFSWTPYHGRVDVEQSDSSSSSSAEDSSEEELIADKGEKRGRSRSPRARKDQEEFFLAFDITEEEVTYMANNPKKAKVFLAKAMEKGKEERWSRLNLEDKHRFDLAQAREISNVITSGALRVLSAEERMNLDFKTVMGMRWVLTTKSDNSAKARLVVLGYQAPNLTEVQTAAPTMAKLSRNLLLTLSANLGLPLRAGDVTSAFLQASQSLEHEGLTIWAPAELAVAFGASPEDPVMPLRIRRAFYGLCHAPRAWFDHISQTMQRLGFKQMLSDRCLFAIYDQQGEICGLAGLHVDDLLLAGDEKNEVFNTAYKGLLEAYRRGKWDEKEFDFAGIRVRQSDDMSIRVDQELYTLKHIEEIPVSAGRAKCLKSEANPYEVSQLRGAIGTIAWRSSQTSPQFQADAGLLLSEIPYATVETLVKTNKLIREMRREASQSLVFPRWNVHWKELAVVSWADASQRSRPDGSSTMGLITGVMPKDFLDGVEHQVAVVTWKSSKTPRQVLGSNGAEVQAVTEAEDSVFRIRALLAELGGVHFDRSNIYEKVRCCTAGAVVMDTRGIFDAATRSVSCLHGLRSSRSGYELTLAVIQALQVQTRFRWVHGGAQLGDGLTKWSSRKVLLQFFAANQRWKLIHDPKFESGRKVKKKELERQMRDREVSFIKMMEELAHQNRWPWIEPQSLRSITDESIRVHAIDNHDM